MYVPSPCVNLREESVSCGLEDKKMIFIHLFWALWKVIQIVSFFVYSSGLMCKQTERKRKTLYLLKKREKKVMPLTSNLYILIVKTQRKSNQILIGFSILRHVSYSIFNFVQSELLSVKIEEFKSNYIINQISIGVQFSTICPSKFLIFVAIKLFGTKIEKSKTN